MKTIKLNEQQIRNIVNRSVKKVLNEMTGNQNFGYAMSAIYHLVDDEVGADEIKETIYAQFYDEDADEFVYNEFGMFAVTQLIANYDLITLNEDGSIDIEGSNRPDIAKKLDPFLTEKVKSELINTYNRWN